MREQQASGMSCSYMIQATAGSWRQMEARPKGSRAELDDGPSRDQGLRAGCVEHGKPYRETEGEACKEFGVCSRTAWFLEGWCPFYCVVVVVVVEVVVVVAVVVVVVVILCLANSGLAHSGCLTNAGWLD